MTNNEQIVRQAYKMAEDMDIEGWIGAFTPDGTFTDESIGVTYRGRDLAVPVVNYHRGFSHMHRELYQVYTTGAIVVVELALQGTHDGPLAVGDGVIEATGNRMDAPCCDVFEL